MKPKLLLRPAVDFPGIHTTNGYDKMPNILSIIIHWNRDFNSISIPDGIILIIVDFYGPMRSDYWPSNYFAQTTGRCYYAIANGEGVISFKYRYNNHDWYGYIRWFKKHNMRIIDIYINHVQHGSEDGGFKPGFQPIGCDVLVLTDAGKLFYVSVTNDQLEWRSSYIYKPLRDTIKFSKPKLLIIPNKAKIIQIQGRGLQDRVYAKSEDNRHYIISYKPKLSRYKTDDVECINDFVNGRDIKSFHWCERNMFVVLED